ncbi:MAG TPA: carbamoyltransferase C-terminal domain-containing protein [Gemmataceae bacterium]|nr:carbamoyltransferase C-terminal domain-containing protein [Gemmataceae bacterium]
MMHTLGINAAFHDPAACLVSDGRVVAAAEEERFTHIKHGKRPVPFSTWELPFHAIDFCLRQAGLAIKDIDHVAYSFDPYLLLPEDHGGSAVIPLKVGSQQPPQGFDTVWDPLFLASIVHAPGHLCDGWPHHLQTRLRGLCPEGMPFHWHWVPHHIAHAASAFHASPFPRAAVLTLDGRGEKATTGYAAGDGNQLRWLGQVEMPHSLGLLYEFVTGYLGFLHSCDEYKVMALASYGQPKFLREFREIVHLGDKGQFTIGELKLEERFGPPRLRGGEIEQKHYDIAASLQVVLEETVLELVRFLHEETKETDLCLAGGVALNCVMNARLRDDGPFNRIWVQPAAGDAGTALGAALWVDARERDAKERSYTMNHSYLGPAFNDVEIEALLSWTKVPFRHLKNVAEETADLLAKDKIIGWFQGRMEFGPRALGGRSILASPINPDMQTRLNEIKDREDFRPVAPVVLEEEADKWFVGAGVSPFMLFVHQVQPEKAKRIPAVRHVDGTARIQTINHQQCPRYYDLLKAFQARTGVPVLVNTSFNTRGEPIVCTPRDAVECFWTSPLDALVIGSYLLEKPSA